MSRRAVDDASDGRDGRRGRRRGAVAAVRWAAVGGDVGGRIRVGDRDRGAIGLAVAQLGDEPASHAGLALRWRRGKDALEAEVGALRARVVAVAADFADAAAVAGARYSAGHGCYAVLCCAVAVRWLVMLVRLVLKVFGGEASVVLPLAVFFLLQRTSSAGLAPTNALQTADLACLFSGPFSGDSRLIGAGLVDSADKKMADERAARGFKPQSGEIASRAAID